ncbi:hypothetical protein N7512_005628 [Penicillium capsulatum]|nr:hypothetical protein N7512_005628 [Penicillium capsulatum]
MFSLGIAGGEIEIVVPDQHVQRAIDVLTATGIFGSPCTKAWSWEDEAKAAKLDVCQHGKLLPHRPIAQAHFDFYRMADGKEVAFPIHIYAKSQIAWELPDPPLVVAENDPNYIASNSIRLPAKAEEGPSGRWLYYPSIAVPRPEKFVETLFFPICRDWRNANAYDIYWRKLLHAMREVRGNPDAVVLKKVGGAFYELWHLFNSGSPEKNNIWRDVDLLKLTLQRVHTFPPPPTFNFFGTAEEARFNGREL